jgi:proteasome-associated ATPase
MVQEMRARLEQTVAANERLVVTLKEARQQIVTLQEELERLAAPSHSYGVLLRAYPDGTADVWTGGRKFHVQVRQDPPVRARSGDEVVLNEALAVIASTGRKDRLGDVATIMAVLDGSDRVVITNIHDDQEVALLTPDLTEVEVGDSVRVDRRAGLVYERLPSLGVHSYLVEEAPSGGLDTFAGAEDQVAELRTALILRRTAQRMGVGVPPILLIAGPASSGKTALARAAAATYLDDRGPYFLHCVQLAQKYFGESERRISETFRRVVHVASSSPAVIILDSMDLLFQRPEQFAPTDRHGCADQLVRELDSLSGYPGVLVIGTCRRPQDLDPAIGHRTAAVVALSRLDERAASALILHCTVTLPSAVDAPDVARQMFSRTSATAVAEVMFDGGHRCSIHLCDVISPAAISRILQTAALHAATRSYADPVVTPEDVSFAIGREVQSARLLFCDLDGEERAKLQEQEGKAIVAIRRVA